MDLQHVPNEAYVVGAALMDGATCARCAELDPSHFRHMGLGKVWGSCLRIYRGGDQPDPVMITDQIGRQYNQLVIDCAARVGTAENARYHMSQVIDQWLDRETRKRLEACLITKDFDGEARLAHALEELAALRLPHIREGRTLMQVIPSLASKLERVQSGDETPGLLTGIDGIDHKIGSMQFGVMYVIGARPSIGKSSLLATLARKVSAHHPVDYYTLEDTEEATASRLLAQTARVDLHDLVQGKLDQRDLDRSHVGMKELYEGIGENLLISDDIPTTLEQFVVVARANAEKRKTKLICVDYFQLFSDPSAGRVTRNEELTRVSQALKRIPAQTNSVLVVASQLSREAEKEPPQLHHLRDCGSLEQDAHAVWMLERRKDWVDTEGEIPAAICHVRKNKNGRVGSVPLYWEAPSVFFDTAAEDIVRRLQTQTRSKKS